MSILTIPSEINRCIVDYIQDRGTLLSLAFSSHELNREASRILYQTFSSPSIPTHLLFFRTVIENPRLACLVRVFHAQLKEQPSPLYHKQATSALGALVNLKELHFRNWDSMPISRILRKATFQLHAFAWRCKNDERGLSSFLTKQHALQRLSVEWRSKTIAIPTHSMHNVHTLRVGHSTIHTIFPDQNVLCLHWELFIRDPPPDIPFISPALRRIRVLVFSTLFLSPPLNLSSFVDCLPNLIFLDLMTVNQADLELVPRLTSLKGLMVSRRKLGYPAIELPSDFLIDLFNELKSLQVIDIDMQDVQDQEIRCQRWTRQNMTDPYCIVMKKNYWWEPYDSLVQELVGEDIRRIPST